MVADQFRIDFAGAVSNGLKRTSSKNNKKKDECE